MTPETARRLAQARVSEQAAYMAAVGKAARLEREAREAREGES